MKILPLSVLLLFFCLTGCKEPEGTRTPSVLPTKRLPVGQAWEPNSQAALGTFRGQGLIKKTAIKVTAEFNQGGQLTWAQEKSGQSETWRGRWRKEARDLLILLTSPSGAVETAVFEPEGKDLKLVRWGNDQISSPDRLLISKVQP